MKKTKYLFLAGQLARLRVTEAQLICWGISDRWAAALSGDRVVEVANNVTAADLASVRINPGCWFVDGHCLRKTKCRAITVEVPRG
jgi:hypothetical protein